ncbi:MAG: ABC transporter ATP-binding protein [Bacillota bacterium]|nr:ABC transporter ATP-binding protein [Bacillota bacterium]HOP53325.1 ABC transporter ATP-binding protein [Bacillota bacterium]HPT61477.1 ABC transporter ATP-binding protein [Bacillota bacterium]HPZ74114.1 ABC transporter ATP-binding protein [Bacillota bacterium]HQD78858.1 ABC transporter ATP-binding protein [Bacillota bacterium]
MKKLLPLMKKYWIFAVLSPLFMVLEVLGDVFIPYLMSRIVDVGIVSQDINFIVNTGMLMVGAALLAMFFGVSSSFFGANAGFGFASEIRQKVFEKVQSFSFANLDSFTVSSLITRLTTDCNTIGQVTMMSLRMAIRAPFMMIFALFMAFKVNASLARVFLISLPLLAVVIIYILTKAKPLFLKQQANIDRVNGVIQENLTNIRVVKSFNRQPFEEVKFKERNDNLMNTALKAISYVILMMPAFNLIVYGTIIAVLWFGGKQIMVGSISGGVIISFVTYITQVLMSLLMISMYFLNLLRGLASASRVVEVLETDSEIKEQENPVREIKDGSVVFENVNFVYPGSTEPTLTDINFTIRSGETVGVVGSTGSSKTTLVQLIPRLYDVTSGSVKVGGVDVREYDLKLLRDKVAFVLQKNTLFSGTIRSNMQWGSENASDEEIIEALKHAQAWEFVSRYEDGLDHIVEQNGDNFSGGQKQRLTIARALLKAPKIIILDDSTSAVDMTTDAKLQKAFKTELSGVTTIIIAQRISSIQHADRIIVMHEGRIESMGTHEELIEKSPIYREIYESQQKGVIAQ